MSKLDEIEERSSRIGAIDYPMVEARREMALLIRAVKQLDEIRMEALRRGHTGGVGQENDTSCSLCIALEAIDLDILELLNE